MFVCSRRVRRVVGLVCRCVYAILVIFRCNVCLSEVWRDDFAECRKKSHSDTMFWGRWRAIINNTWTHKLSTKGDCLFTFKGAKHTEPASLSWGRFVSVFYGDIYIITHYKLREVLILIRFLTWFFIFTSKITFLIIFFMWERECFGVNYFFIKNENI